MDKTIKILKKTENELELVLTGEGHTLMSILRKELFNDPSVIHTGYMVKHPLIKEVRFYIKTKKDKKPLQALKDALKRLEGLIDEFETKFEDIMAES
ncbi:MAG: DNA-directed RNA polymerase subunit L [Candidatus Helarchaeota archaeon]|nr:DNA-directed RNA polymerase subunit L [Candidatus Helarchaeota archaeon]